MQKGSFTCKVHRLVNRLWLDLYLGQLWTCWLEVVVQKHPSVLQVHHWKPDLCWSWNWCSSQSLWEKQWSPDCWTIPCQTHTKLPSHFSAHNLINTKKGCEAANSFSTCVFAWVRTEGSQQVSTDQTMAVSLLWHLHFAFEASTTSKTHDLYI